MLKLLPLSIELLILKYKKQLEYVIIKKNNLKQLKKVIPKYQPYFCNKQSSYLYKNLNYWNRNFVYK